MEWIESQVPDWGHPNARETRAELAALFTRPGVISTLATLAGMKTGGINFSAGATHIWHSLIGSYGTKERKKLLALAVEACPTEGARKGLIEAIGADPRE